eukprot:156540_1
MHTWLGGSGQTKSKSSGPSMFPSFLGFGRKNTVNQPPRTYSNNITNNALSSSRGIISERSNSNHNNEFDRADDVVLPLSSNLNRSSKANKSVRFADNLNEQNHKQRRESRKTRQSKARRKQEREAERERERSRSREREREKEMEKKAMKEKQKQWIKRTDSRIIALVNAVKGLRSGMKNIEQRLDESEKRNNVFVIAPNRERATSTTQAIPYYDYGQQTENVQTMMNPFICALNEALNRNQNSQQHASVNINFISLNQTRNKVATHNQTVKLNNNTPRLCSQFEPVVQVRSNSNHNFNQNSTNRVAF